MKKALKRIKSNTYYFVDGEKVDGVPHGIKGDLTGIKGDLTGISGDLTGISGDLTGIRGNLTGIMGNLTYCDISEEERKNGIDVIDLIQE